MALRPRLISRSLAGYLCGTHSGPLARRRGDRLAVEQIPAAHRQVHSAGASTHSLGGTAWRPPAEAAGLADVLARSLAAEGVRDLIVFGSQARGGTTPFSDLDAILVIEDEVAEDAAALRRLRPAVLRAQRAVLAWQPMQHHGFEVVTARLLTQAAEALAMPAVALSEARSLRAATTPARFGEGDGLGDDTPLRSLVGDVTGFRSWPTHPWELHRAVSMFELLPTLWLQARGQAVPKWRSFAVARPLLGDAWWPYETLERVRRDWPRSHSGAFSACARAARNPWLAIEARRRSPLQRRHRVRDLTPDCLDALHTLANRMIETAG